jgi:hypothetical protein
MSVITDVNETKNVTADSYIFGHSRGTRRTLRGKNGAIYGIVNNKQYANWGENARGNLHMV